MLEQPQDQEQPDVAQLQSIEENPVAMSGFPRAFRHLDRRGKILRVLATAALVLHISSMLIGSAISPIRNFFAPVLGFYTDGLRMTNSWGMFGKPPVSTNVDIEGVLDDGTSVPLSTTDAHKRSWLERIKDVRIRKIEGKLSEEPDRSRLASSFLDYYCRQATARYENVREVKVANRYHETYDDAGNITRHKHSATVSTRPCRKVQGQPPAVLPSSFRGIQPPPFRPDM